MSSEKAQFKAVADRSRCCGYGLCATICPSVYKLDADGLVYFDDARVPPNLKKMPARALLLARPKQYGWSPSTPKTAPLEYTLT